MASGRKVLSNCAKGQLCPEKAVVMDPSSALRCRLVPFPLRGNTGKFTRQRVLHVTRQPMSGWLGTFKTLFKRRLHKATSAAICLLTDYIVFTLRGLWLCFSCLWFMDHRGWISCDQIYLLLIAKVCLIIVPLFSFIVFFLRSVTIKYFLLYAHGSLLQL